MKLCESGLQNDVLMEFQFIIHPYKGGVDLGFRYPAYQAMRGVLIVLAADPENESTTSISAGERSSAFPTEYFQGQWIWVDNCFLAAGFPFEQFLHLIK